MQKCSLSFAKESESRLIDGRSANGPCVADVYLLRPVIRQISKAGEVRAASLKAGKRLFQMMLRKVIVAGQLLISREFMIDLHRELVRVLVTKWHTLKECIADVCLRHKMVQKVQCRLVHALRWDVSIGKNVGVICAIRDGAAQTESA